MSKHEAALLMAMAATSKSQGYALDVSCSPIDYARSLNHTKQQRIKRNEPTDGIVSRLFNAANKGIFDGQYITTYLESCRWYIERIDAQVVMTRDAGYHTSGWWKNPDYERCYHLSIDYPGGNNLKKTEWLLCALFGSSRKLMWCEPPYSEHGKKLGVYHYRLFCDEAWKPIMPRGEVYSTQFTERGWKSFSEIHNGSWSNR